MSHGVVTETLKGAVKCFMNKAWKMSKIVVRRDKFELKSMFNIFFRTRFVVHIDCAIKGQTIDIENCLRLEVQTLKSERPVMPKFLKFSMATPDPMPK